MLTFGFCENLLGYQVLQWRCTIWIGFKQNCGRLHLLVSKVSLNLKAAGYSSQSSAHLLIIDQVSLTLQKRDKKEKRKILYLLGCAKKLSLILSIYISQQIGLCMKRTLKSFQSNQEEYNVVPHCSTHFTHHWSSLFNPSKRNKKK